MTVQADTARILAPCLYILNRTGKISKHHLSKILYFADKAHIAKYGRSLTGDRYIAMKNGPVPSRIYDFIKYIEGISSVTFLTDHIQYISAFIGFQLQYYVFAKKEADMDFLSVSAIKALDESLATYRNKSFSERTDLSHDEAWKTTGLNKEIFIIDITKAAGANSAMIDYIKATM